MENNKKSIKQEIQEILMTRVGMFILGLLIGFIIGVII